MAILIITDNLDYEVDNVINWIISFKKKVYRYTFDDLLKNAQITYDIDCENKLSIRIEGNLIESGWLRKEVDSYERLYELENEFDFKLGYELFKFIKKETSVSKQIFLSKNNFRWLCDYKSVNVNKIEVLEIAQKCGLNIPKSIVTNNLSNLRSFIKKNKIDKRIDLRIFFINNSFYAMAIDAESVDCRMIDNNTRYYPFLIPKFIEKNLLLLMDRLNLNYGSIDLAVDKKNVITF